MKEGVSSEYFHNSNEEVVQTISSTSSTQVNANTTIVVLTKRATAATGLLLANVEKIEGRKITIINYNDNTGYWNFASGLVHTPSGAEVRRVALETTSEITCINDEWILTNISLRDGVYQLDGWLHMAYLTGTYIVGNTGVNNNPTFNMVIDNGDNLDIRMTIKNVTPKPMTVKSYPTATNLVDDSGVLVESITLPIGKTVSFIGTGTEWQQLTGNVDLVNLNQLDTRLLDFSNGYEISSAISLTVAPVAENSYYTFTGTTSTWTLAPIEVTANKFITLINMGNGDITVVTDEGEDDIWDGGNPENTLTIIPGTTMRIFNNSIKYIINF